MPNRPSNKPKLGDKLLRLALTPEAYARRTGAEATQDTRGRVSATLGAQKAIPKTGGGLKERMMRILLKPEAHNKRLELRAAQVSDNGSGEKQATTKEEAAAKPAAATKPARVSADPKEIPKKSLLDVFFPKRAKGGKSDIFGLARLVDKFKIMRPDLYQDNGEKPGSDWVDREAKALEIRMAEEGHLEATRMEALSDLDGSGGLDPELADAEPGDSQAVKEIRDFLHASKEAQCIVLSSLATDGDVDGIVTRVLGIDETTEEDREVRNHGITKLAKMIEGEASENETALLLILESSVVDTPTRIKALKELNKKLNEPEVQQHLIPILRELIRETDDAQLKGQALSTKKSLIMKQYIARTEVEDKKNMINELRKDEDFDAIAIIVEVFSESDTIAKNAVTILGENVDKLTEPRSLKAVIVDVSEIVPIENRVKAAIKFRGLKGTKPFIAHLITDDTVRAALGLSPKNSDDETGFDGTERDEETTDPGVPDFVDDDTGENQKDVEFTKHVRGEGEVLFELGGDNDATKKSAPVESDGGLFANVPNDDGDTYAQNPFPDSGEEILALRKPRSQEEDDDDEDDDDDDDDMNAPGIVAIDLEESHK